MKWHKMTHHTNWPIATYQLTAKYFDVWTIWELLSDRLSSSFDYSTAIQTQLLLHYITYVNSYLRLLPTGNCLFVIFLIIFHSMEGICFALSYAVEYYLRSHRFQILPPIFEFPTVFRASQYIPPCFVKIIIFPLYFYKFPPCFRKIHVFFQLCVFRFPPTLTMMHLCITQCTYWMPLIGRPQWLI